MSLLQEIRNQPEGIRKAMFTLSVVAVISLVGTVWLSSFKKNVYALMNPASVPGAEQSQFAQQGPPDDIVHTQSPFALVGSFFGNLRGSIAELFTGSDLHGTPTQASPLPVPTKSVNSGKAKSLPVSQ